MGKDKKHREHRKSDTRKKDDNEEHQEPPKEELERPALPFFWYKTQATEAQPTERLKEGSLFRLSSKGKAPREYHVLARSDSLSYRSGSSSRASHKILFTNDVTVTQTESITVPIIVAKMGKSSESVRPKKIRKHKKEKSDDDDNSDDDESEDGSESESETNDSASSKNKEESDSDESESESEEEEEEDIQLYGFTVENKENKVTFYTDNEKSAKKWTRHIEKCVRERRSSPLKIPSDDIDFINIATTPATINSNDTDNDNDESPIKKKEEEEEEEEEEDEGKDTDTSVSGSMEKLDRGTSNRIRYRKVSGIIKEIHTYAQNRFFGDDVRMTWKVFAGRGTPCIMVITKYKAIVASADYPLTIFFEQHLLNLGTVRLASNSLYFERNRAQSPSQQQQQQQQQPFGATSTSPALLSNGNDVARVVTSTPVMIAFEIHQALREISSKKYWPKLVVVHKGKDEKTNWEDLLLVQGHTKDSSEDKLKKKIVGMYLSRCCLLERAPDRCIVDYLSHAVKTSASELDFTQCTFGASGCEDAVVAMDAFRGTNCFRSVVIVGPRHTARGSTGAAAVVAAAAVPRALTEFVESNISVLTRVVARGIDMDEKGATAFGDTLRHVKGHKICEVSFADNPLRDAGLSTLVGGLLERTTVGLRALDLSGCGMSPKGAKALFTTLRKYRDTTIFLHELYLSGNRLEDLGSAALNDWISEFPEGTPSLKKLALAGTKVNFELLPALEAVSLELLDISGIQLSVRACAVLKNVAVNVCRFVANGCVAQGKDLIEDVLKGFFSRGDKSKQLECNGAGTPFLHPVSSALAKTSTRSITRLSLSGTMYSREGFARLVSAIIMCESLSELNLSSPAFDSPNTVRGNELLWAQSLATIVAECGSLATIDLSHGYGPTVITNFLEILSENPKHVLRLLDISGNDIGDRGAAAIARLLKSGGPLMGLVYGANNISPSGILTIAAEVSSNKTILLLDSGSRKGVTCGICSGLVGSVCGFSSDDYSGGSSGNGANGSGDDYFGCQGFGLINTIRAERVISSVLLRNIGKLKGDYSKVPSKLKSFIAVGDSQFNPWVSSLPEDYVPFLINSPLKSPPKVPR